MENHLVKLIKNKNLVFAKKKLEKLDKKKIRIKIKSTGVCASDIPRAYNNGAYHYPLVMGHEITGVIYESRIKNFKKKEKVSIFPLLPCKKCINCKLKKYNHCNSYSYYGSRQDGGFAKYIDVDPWNIVKLQKNINFLDSFAMEPSAVALNTINKTFKKKIKKNEKILLTGSGFIGLLIAKLIKTKFKFSNLTIIDRNKHKLNFAPKNCRKVFLKKGQSKILKKFKDSFDYVIDTTGSAKIIPTLLNYAKNHASITLMGNINNDIYFKKKEINLILRKELKIIGIWNSNYKNSSQSDWSEVLKLFKKGFKPSKYISHKINLKELPKYINKIYMSRKEKRKFKFLKLVVCND